MLEKVENFKWEPGVIMLHMGYKDIGTVMGIDGFFDLNQKESWFENEFCPEVVKEIDKTKMVLPGFFKSPWLGNIDATKISGGAKGIILQYNTVGNILPLASFGLNCFNKIYELSLLKETHYYYEGYFPIGCRDDLMFYDIDASVIFNNASHFEWYRDYAVDPVLLNYQPYRPDGDIYVPEVNEYEDF